MAVLTVVILTVATLTVAPRTVLPPPLRSASCLAAVAIRTTS